MYKVRLLLAAAAMLLGLVANLSGGVGRVAYAAIASKPLAPVVAVALENYGRPQLDLYRDKDLKPGAVMTFAGIAPSMAVADIMPGDGYWTRIISAIVGKKGNAYMFVIQPRNAKPERDPNQNEAYSRVVNANAVASQPEFPNIAVYWDALGAFPDHFNLPKQLDAVMLADYATIKAEEPKWDMVKGNTAIFRAMKNGGTYLVMGAAADQGSGFSEASLGRSDPAAVKAEVLAAGFVLDGQSNVLARPNDPHTAPANDSSDMYMLRFKKPLNAPNTNRRVAHLRRAMGIQLNSTRASNPGLMRRADTGHDRERRVIYHPNMTYEEWGQMGSGNNPWQSGTWFLNADGGTCMQHLFPTNQQGFINCEYTMPPADVKPGDLWWEGTLYRLVGRGKQQYKDVEATEGGTLGDTLAERAHNFGRIVAFLETHGASQKYIDEYLTAYFHFRKESGGDAATLDKQFSSAYGKPVPAQPSPRTEH